MFARVQSIHQPARKLGEMTMIAREQRPAAQGLPGFRGFYYLVDRANGKALVISLWETEDHVHQVEANVAARERTAEAAGIESPPAELFEVALQY
jgi:heme-degrading monooxygenase HmoA